MNTYSKHQWAAAFETTEVSHLQGMDRISYAIICGTYAARKLLSKRRWKFSLVQEKSYILVILFRNIVRAHLVVHQISELIGVFKTLSNI